MNRNIRQCGWAMLLAVAMTPATFANDEAQTLVEAVTGGEPGLSFRYRFESVDQDGLTEDASASVLKTRLNYRTAGYQGWSAFIEMDDVSYLGQDHFNNTRNGMLSRPVVADPDGTHVNQFYLKSDRGGWTATLGRQRINRNNQRFLGGVAWRQNEQTYDAVSLESRLNDNASVSYAYVNRISRIFGPDSGAPAPALDSNSHFVDGHFRFSESATIDGYGYFIDSEDAVGFGSRTIGLRFHNRWTRDALRFPLTVEFADQQDFGDNPVSYSAHYFLLEAGVAKDAFSFDIGAEVLGGDTLPGKSFRTPLATLHKFQGWADKFLTTPAAGIEDQYLKFGYKKGAAGLQVMYHRFEAEAVTMDYGSELDLSLSYKLNERVGVLIKAASYEADLFATDTTKVWVMLTADF